MGFTGSFHEDGSPGHVDDYIPEIGQVTSDQFAEWVMLAEGLEPFDGSGFQDDFKKLFARHLGSHVVDASLLKHSVDSSANQ
ncbi:MAG TPA: hypothetical protein VGN36_08530 [Sphingorhabdus sp.]|jgi:hypothetical protein|nr:hypothetical protein [Sphingorhabdus sp.]